MHILQNIEKLEYYRIVHSTMCASCFFFFFIANIKMWFWDKVKDAHQKMCTPNNSAFLFCKMLFFLKISNAKLNIRYILCIFMKSIWFD